jgi:hypothetical protein
LKTRKHWNWIQDFFGCGEKPDKVDFWLFFWPQDFNHKPDNCVPFAHRSDKCSIVFTNTPLARNDSWFVTAGFQPADEQPRSRNDNNSPPQSPMDASRATNLNVKSLMLSPDFLPVILNSLFPVFLISARTYSSIARHFNSKKIQEGPVRFCDA